MESWGNYPYGCRRLFSLIEKAGAGGVLSISGDMHFSELYKEGTRPYRAYDFTSSGMTHASEDWVNAVNSYRLGEAYSGHNFGLIRIEWARKDPLVYLETFKENGDRALHHTISLSTL